MKQLLEHVAKALERLGLERRDRQVFTSQLAPDILGWVGLNVAAKDGPTVNPVIGVRFQKVEALVAELKGIPFHSFLPPTLSTPLGYLAPEQRLRIFDFSGQLNDGKEMDTLVDEVRQYGLPFMQRASDRETARDLLGTGRFGVPIEAAYRVPILFFVDGDFENCRRLLEAGSGRWGIGPHAAAVQFRHFCDGLAARLSH